MEKPLINIFISYSPEDTSIAQVFKNGIHLHIRLSDRYSFDISDPGVILPGAERDKELREKLNNCDLAILCISAAYLAMDNDLEKELNELLNTGAPKKILPVYVKQCNYQIWESISGIPVYKPTGQKYDKGPDENFAFCDLVDVVEAGGMITAIPDKRIDLYFKDLAHYLEEILSGGQIKTESPAPIHTAVNTEYINEINYPYFEETDFFGREKLLKEIDKKLKKQKLPLILSGVGGMGKTTAAIAYGQLPEYAAAYQYIGWVNVTDGLYNSLCSTFKGNKVLPFEYSRDGNRESDIASMMQLLKNSAGNNLLLIDNVNNEQDIQKFINLWKKYKPSWKCIITTRTNNQAYIDHMLTLDSLSPDAAEQLFRKNNPSDEFNLDSFLNLYIHTGGHTFVLELLAKYAETSSSIKNTDQLAAHLGAKGIKALTLSVTAKQGQQEDADKNVSDFLFGLYDPLLLSEKNQEYIRYFSVLPPSEIDFEKLVYLFGINSDETDNFDTALRTLAKEGWLNCTKKGFSCQQIIAQICREKLIPDEHNCINLLNALYTLFRKKDLVSAVPYFENAYYISAYINAVTEDYADMQLNLAQLSKSYGNMTYVFPLLECAEKIYSVCNRYKYAICLERIGDAHMIQKNKSEKREAALQAYTKYNEVAKELSSANPEIISYIHIQSISEFKLGEVWQKSGDTLKAMEHYNLALRRGIFLCEEFPENVEYRHVVSGTYSKIGEMFLQENMPDEAEKMYNYFFETQRALAEKFPEDENSQNFLSVAYFKLGELWEIRKDLEKAAANFKQYKEIKEKLWANKKEDIQYQSGMAVAYARLANVSAGEEKKTLLLKAKEIADDMIQKMPENSDFQITWKWINNQLIKLGLLTPAT